MRNDRIADRQAEGTMSYQLFDVKGSKVGQVNGLAALDPGNGMAEYSGIMLPIVAACVPSIHKDGGQIIATGKLGEIAKEAVQNISAVLKSIIGEDMGKYDIIVRGDFMNEGDLLKELENHGYHVTHLGRIGKTEQN